MRVSSLRRHLGKAHQLGKRQIVAASPTGQRALHAEGSRAPPARRPRGEPRTKSVGSASGCSEGEIVRPEASAPTTTARLGELFRARSNRSPRRPLDLKTRPGPGATGARGVHLTWRSGPGPRGPGRGAAGRATEFSVVPLASASDSPAHTMAICVPTSSTEKGGRSLRRHPGQAHQLGKRQSVAASPTGQERVARRGEHSDSASRGRLAHVMVGQAGPTCERKELETPSWTSTPAWQATERRGEPNGPRARRTPRRTQ